MGQVETVVIVGKKGTLRVNVDELAAWKAKGYKTEAEVAADDADKKKGKGKGDKAEE